MCLRFGRLIFGMACFWEGFIIGILRWRAQTFDTEGGYYLIPNNDKGCREKNWEVDFSIEINYLQTVD